MEIKFISAEETYPLRHLVLQPHLDYESVYLDRDKDPSSLHLGVVEGGNIISIGSFHQKSNSKFTHLRQYQLRKMATSPQYRNLQAGKTLLHFAIDHLKREEVALLWCNARKVALGFYQKSGFKTVGDFFEEPGFGLHKLMYIEL